eukprot:CAMPEP_0174997584 /NCGR_PEP_ID=MMETSP0005-20121125/1034_1 /TAXON_ID=420556 /ORGANISM="Ochromonas sp., Strain CCMP1393" /LENGTH=260 /DNA_ID=CAMNT_0016252125 /DNA_START=145 /DNA_END=924 /DNA_ORIENTATION=-
MPVYNYVRNQTQILPLQPSSYSSLPLLMGILNVTPDSFSDGGKYGDSTHNAVLQALDFVEQGASIIDVGGESTRPGAAEVSTEEELNRVLPVIRAIRERESEEAKKEAGKKRCLISIDTRKAAVAIQAIQAGADIVNDVSAGKHDPEMLPALGYGGELLGVPFIAMHMRGDPATMQSPQNLAYTSTSTSTTTSTTTSTIPSNTTNSAAAAAAAAAVSVYADTAAAAAAAAAVSVYADTVVEVVAEELTTQLKEIDAHIPR